MLVPVIWVVAEATATGGRDAVEDQDRRGQEAAADADHAGQQADQPAEADDHQRVHRKARDRQVDVHGGGDPRVRTSYPQWS